MAKYADYVKDQLDNEIEDASQNQQVRQETPHQGFEMPKQFEGKSPEEIAASYMELQKLNSKQAQDLGSMRKTVDTLMSLQSQPTAEPPAEPQEPAVDIDAIYDNPEEAISRVAKKTVGSQIEKLEKALEEKEREAALTQFEENYGDWRETANSPEFLEWVQGSPYRLRLAQAADAYDFDAANDLFAMYEDHTGTAQAAEAEATRNQQLNDATLETSSPGTIDTDETFSRQNLMDARIAAQKGDASARQWLAANGDAIALAYEEGRITD